MKKRLLSVGFLAAFLFVSATHVHAQRATASVAVDDTGARALLAGDEIRLHLPMKAPVPTGGLATAWLLSPSDTISGSTSVDFVPDARAVDFKLPWSRDKGKLVDEGTGWYRIATIACFTLPAIGQVASEPEVAMAFSSDHILLGEPVWVLVTVRNRSDTPVRWNPGDYCPMESEQPVTAVIPEAAQGNGKPEPCEYGAAGGDCMMGGSTTDLAPNQSATWKFLLEGNFQFTHAGTYQVKLTSHPGPEFHATADKDAKPSRPAPATETLTLEILPRNDAALLLREKQMAADLESEILSRKAMPPPNQPEARETSWRNMQNVRQVRRGLAAQPVPGMEVIFEHWLQLPNDFENDAIQGLRMLNTKESRAALAEIARTPGKPNSFTRDGATVALGDLRDPEYYPLMAELLASPNNRVRREAIFGLGSLGGDRAVPKLVELARDGNQVDESDALTSLGNTKSRLAVQALIELMIAPNALHPLDAEWELFVLTHHHLPHVPYLRTAQQAHDLWLQWWNVGGKSA